MNILIIDDEANIRKTVQMYLKSSGHHCQGAANCAEALQLNQQAVYDAAFLDLRLGVDNGLDLIAPLLNCNPQLKIIVMTAFSSIDTAVQAIKLGAFDYIGKPFNPHAIDLLLDKVAKMSAMETRLSNLDSALKSLHPHGIFDSANRGMQKILQLAHQVAASECAVLLRGESGTGKTVLAKAIHQWSHRHEAPFGTISCPALSADLLASELFGHVKGAFTGAVKDQPGRIASCDHGTIFLDEIGDLPLSIQPKLLRFLQDKEYESVGSVETRRADVRIIAATNVDLEKAIQEKNFREDLFFRLNVIQLTLLPLRERREDILPLAQNMLNFFAQNSRMERRFAPEVASALQHYDWPGNLRELRNAVERAVILSAEPEIPLSVFPEAIQGQTAGAVAPVPEDCSLESMEKHHIAQVIAHSNSFQEAAEKLGIDQATLWRKRKIYKL